MTLASAVLLVLEPGPVVPGSELLLTRFDRANEPVNVLFETSPSVQGQRWDAIVIHHSGSMEGSARTISDAHERMGVGGLGYHFVLNNGRGGPDGQIVVGFRWRRQLDGAYAAGPDAAWYNHNAIGVCLIGDPTVAPPTTRQMDELVWLVRELQQKFSIPSENVLVQGGDDESGAGRLFPAATFRQQLLPVSGR